MVMLLYVFILIVVPTIMGQTFKTVNISSTCILQATMSGSNYIKLNSTMQCDCTGYTLPPDLLNTTNTQQLTTIYLPNCNLSGTIFSNIAYNQLLYVELQGNSFAEILPTSLPIAHLITFNIANNQFYGTVPNLGFQAFLNTFVLANNSLTGIAQYVIPATDSIQYFSIAGNRFYIDNSNTIWQNINPKFIAGDGVKNGVVQIDCIYRLKGVSGGKIPNWCEDIDNSGDSKCICDYQCGNGFVEDGEDCDPLDPTTGACCNNITCKFVPPGTPCVATITNCTAYTCNAQNSCVASGVLQIGTTCRPAASICDIAELCNGNTTDCPQDKFQDDGFLCRPGMDCDAPEFCQNGTCPDDVLYGKTHQCRDKNDTCAEPAYCLGDSAICPPNTPSSNMIVCRNASSGKCDKEEICSGIDFSCPIDSFMTSGVCRPALSICDVAESCDGSGPDCPNDTFVGGIVCRNQTGTCDVVEICNGSSPLCPDDKFATSDTVCRASNGTCDTAENCTFNNATCPPDAFLGTGQVCRGKNGTCDIAEYCLGNSSQCPDDAFMQQGQTCRPSEGTCDTPEICLGDSPYCPADTFLPSSELCRDKNETCDKPDYCTGSSPICPGDEFLPSTQICWEQQNETCDFVLYCTGNTAKCPVGDPPIVICPTCDMNSCSDNGFCNTTSGKCQCINALLDFPNCTGCGDNYCDSKLENCVNCPADCHFIPCGMCGDGICDIIFTPNGNIVENCTTCSEDCCQQSTCDPPCEHGTCANGLCLCDESYTGPSCNNTAIPVNVTNNDTSPIVSVHVTGLDSTNFSISLRRIFETDIDGHTLKDVDLTNVDFVLQQSVFVDYVLWNYTTTMFKNNFTVLHIYIFHFTSSTNFTFAGRSNFVGANTIKLALYISDWPFFSVQNSLHVVFDNSVPDSQNLQPCNYHAGENREDDLRWYKLTIGGTTLYAQMDDAANLDGYMRDISFYTYSPTTVAAKISYFWNNLTLDPQYTVLVEDTDPCAKSFVDSLRNSEHWNWFYLIPIVVVIIAIVVLLWKYESLRVWTALRRKPRLVVEMDETTGTTTTHSVEMD